MGRYETAFSSLKRQNEKALVGFTILGDPDENTSMEIIKAMLGSGVDILELGMPFSDPLADGPVIQAAGMRALKNGFNTDSAFGMIKGIRQLTNKPIGLLVYYNLVYQRGIDKFYSDAASVGVDSVLAADLPLEESDEVLDASRKNSISQVYIVSELTSDERMDRILKKSSGFVYAVARLGVTGIKEDLHDSATSLVRRIKSKAELPVCVGFGISRPEHVKKVCSVADGAIVGSGVVKIIGDNLSDTKAMLKGISDYIHSLKAATKNIK